MMEKFIEEVCVKIVCFGKRKDSFETSFVNGIEDLHFQPQFYVEKKEGNNLFESWNKRGNHLCSVSINNHFLHNKLQQAHLKGFKKNKDIHRFSH